MKKIPWNDRPRIVTPVSEGGSAEAWLVRVVLHSQSPAIHVPRRSAARFWNTELRGCRWIRWVIGFPVQMTATAMKSVISPVYVFTRHFMICQMVWECGVGLHVRCQGHYDMGKWLAEETRGSVARLYFGLDDPAGISFVSCSQDDHDSKSHHSGSNGSSTPDAINDVSPR